MSIRKFRTFVAVARYGSFVAAAREIGLTQAAVSVQMSALESELELQLFDRSARTVVLNSQGRALLPRAAELLRLYDTMPFGAGKDEIGGALALGAIPPTFERLLPDALLRMRQRNPRVAVRVATGVSSDLVGRVERGELDAAIVAEPPFKLSRGLVWHPIVAEPLVLLVSSRTKVTTLASVLQQSTFIGISRQSWTGQLVHAMLRRHRLAVHEAMELDSLDTICAMVARGFGVSIMPLAPSQWGRNRRVHVYRLVNPATDRQIGLVHRFRSGLEALEGVLLQSLLQVPQDRVHKSTELSIRSLTAQRKGSG